MYKKTVKVLKKEHQELYNKMTQKYFVEAEDLETGDKNAVAKKDVDKDDDDVEVLNPFSFFEDEEDDFFCDLYQKPLSVYKRDREADRIVDSWLKHQVNYLDFLRDKFS